VKDDWFNNENNLDSKQNKVFINFTTMDSIFFGGDTFNSGSKIASIIKCISSSYMYLAQNVTTYIWSIFWNFVDLERYNL